MAIGAFEDVYLSAARFIGQIRANRVQIAARPNASNKELPVDFGRCYAAGSVVEVEVGS